MEGAANSVQVGRARYGGSFAMEGGGELPLVLPGERVAVDGAGELTILEASEARVAPRCVHFGQCGGCQYQYAGYTTQLELKSAILQDLFSRAGLSSLPAPAIHSREPWGYRNRIRLRVREAAEGIEVGYSRRGTNDFLPVRMCPIAAPVLWRAAEALMQLAQEDLACRRWLRAAAEVELFTTGDESRLQMRLFLRNAEVATQKESGFAQFCETVQGRLPELVGAGVELDPELGRRVRRSWAGTRWGAEGLGYSAAGRTYWVSRGSFFQVNRFLVDTLVDLVAGGSTGGLALDLYAGVGLFSRALAERFERVVAVEGGEAAAADLMHVGKARKGGGSRGFQAVRAPIMDFLRSALTQRERPERIVLDPPRAGLGAEGCALLARFKPAEIVYVSCDPVTLTRDLTVLAGEGYHGRAIDLVDLFPQTFHLETVVHLQRG